MKSHPAATTVAALSGVLLAGCVAMAVAHAGVAVPVLSRFGPGGNDAVWPAVVAFSVGSVLMTAIVVGALRRRPWAWALGVVVHGLVIFGALTPYRGIGSLVAVLISVTVVALLLSRPGRTALLPAQP